MYFLFRDKVAKKKKIKKSDVNVIININQPHQEDIIQSEYAYLLVRYLFRMCVQILNV